VGAGGAEARVWGESAFPESGSGGVSSQVEHGSLNGLYSPEISNGRPARTANSRMVVLFWPLDAASFATCELRSPGSLIDVGFCAFM
jgi:hypothetical protein